MADWELLLPCPASQESLGPHIAIMEKIKIQNPKYISKDEWMRRALAAS